MISSTVSKICSIENCEKPHFGKGWCRKHFERWRRHGDPLFVKRIRGDDVARFWSYVDKSRNLGPNGDCWLWRGPTTGRGYGQLEIQYAQVLAHRYSFFLAYGHFPHPVGRHSCDTPLCVRPDHILEGTQSQNINDAVERGRWEQKGTANPSAKLTDQDVLNIRKKRKEGVKLKILALEYLVSESTLSSICSGHLWPHLPL